MNGTTIEAPVVDRTTMSVVVPIGTAWSRGTTQGRMVRLSPAQAENLAHELIVAAAEIRGIRQRTARG